MFIVSLLITTKNWKRTQMSFNGWIDKQTLGEPCNRILLGNKRKLNTELTYLHMRVKITQLNIEHIMLSKGRQNQMAVRINLYDILEKRALL